MKDTWKQISDLRHDLVNEQTKLKFVIESIKRIKEKINLLDTKVLGIIEEVEKLER